MFGVVLWSAENEQKAVIWCEDHGNLAFYTEKQSSMHGGVSLDAGDLISFELYEDDSLRYAQNPKLVAQDEYPDLAHRVSDYDQRRGSATVEKRDENKNVISFRSKEDQNANRVQLC